MKKLIIVVVLMIINTCLISQNNFCFDSLQIKEIRRKIDNSIIYEQLVDSLELKLYIERRMVENLKVDISIEKEQNVDLTRSITLYQQNENKYNVLNKKLEKEIKKEKNQKRIIVGIIVVFEILQIFVL